MELVRVMQDLSLSTGGLAWDTYFSLLGMVVREGRPDLVELIATQGSTCDMELQKRNGGVWMRTSLNSTYLGPNSEQASNLQELRSSILKKRVPLWIFAKNAVELWRWECCLSKLKATSIKMTKYGMFYPDDVLACFLPLPDPEARDIVMGPLDLNLSPFSEQYPEHFNRLGAFITDYQLAVIQISTSHQCVFDWLITHRVKGDFGRDVELSGLETVTISQLPGAAIPKAEQQEVDIAICDNLLFGQDFWKLILHPNNTISPIYPKFSVPAKDMSPDELVRDVTRIISKMPPEAIMKPLVIEYGLDEPYREWWLSFASIDVTSPQHNITMVAQILLHAFPRSIEPS